MAIIECCVNGKENNGDKIVMDAKEMSNDGELDSFSQCNDNYLQPISDCGTFKPPFTRHVENYMPLNTYQEQI